MLRFVVTRGLVTLLASVAYVALIFSEGPLYRIATKQCTEFVPCFLSHTYQPMHQLHLDWIFPIFLVVVSFGATSAVYLGVKSMLTGRTVERYRVTPDTP
jgi:hypothetical protein